MEALKHHQRFHQLHQSHTSSLLILGLDFGGIVLFRHNWRSTQLSIGSGIHWGVIDLKLGGTLVRRNEEYLIGEMLGLLTRLDSDETHANNKIQEAHHARPKQQYSQQHTTDRWVSSSHHWPLAATPCCINTHRVAHMDKGPGQQPEVLWLDWFHET